MTTSQGPGDTEDKPAVRPPRPKSVRKAPEPAKQAADTGAAPVADAPPATPGDKPSDTRRVAVSAAQLLDSIYFAHNDATLEEATAQLQAVVAFASRKDTRGLLLITGYADSAENAPYELSLRRATAVRDFLIQHGVPPLRIKIEGLGDSQPGSGELSQSSRNQRVEIRRIDA